MLDEFHERHLHGDVALALVERLRRTARPICARRDERDARDGAARRVPRRAGPARRRASASTSQSSTSRPGRSAHRVAGGLRRARARLRGLEGDVLVFLPGAGEIRRAREACATIATKRTCSSCRSTATSPRRSKTRRSAPANSRKVILSTNVAESSITIEGVVAVVDCGTARVASHAPWSGFPRLRVESAARRRRSAPVAQGERDLAVHAPLRGGSIAARARHARDTPARPHADVARPRGARRQGPAVARRAARSDVRGARELLRRLGALDDTGAIPSPGERCCGSQFTRARRASSSRQSGVGSRRTGVWRRPFSPKATCGRRAARIRGPTDEDGRPTRPISSRSSTCSERPKTRGSRRARSARRLRTPARRSCGREVSQPTP